MYCDYNKPLAVKLINQQIKAYEKMLSFVPAIEQTIKQFDGKQANKRIETALQKAYKYIYFRKNQYSNVWELEISAWDDRAVCGEPDSYGICSTSYISDDRIYLAADYNVCFVDENGRLIAEKMIECIEQKKEHYQNQVNQMREQLANIEAIIQEYKRIQQLKEDFNKNTNYMIRDYFHLELH